MDDGRRVMNRIEVDLDSSLEDLFSRVEEKVKKDITTMVTRHGLKLERADLPLKWSGLQDGDCMSALYHKHPPSRERCFQVVTSSQESLAAARLSKTFPGSQPVSMGAFGDAIAQAPGPADTQTAGKPPAPDHPRGFDATS